jgi:hypothetical protein
VILFAVAATAILAGALATVALMPRRGVVPSLLAFGLVAWAACVGTVALGGTLLASLSPSTLVLLALVWASVMVVIAWRSARWPELRERARQGMGTAWRIAAWWPAAAALALVAIALAWRIFLATRLPVVDLLGWQYHLVIVDVWLQSNAIVPVHQNIWTDGWPASGELLTAWLAAFTRTDGLTGMTGVLPIPVAMLATTGLARCFGASRGPALLAGLLFGVTPAMLAMAGTSYLDTALVASVLASWYVGLRILRGERDWAAALAFGIAAGLAIGIKGTSFVLVMPLVAAVGVTLIVAASRRAERSAAGRATLATVAMVALPVVLLGASWYLRNLLLHGNPMYPIAFGPWPGVSHYGEPGVPAELIGRGAIEQVALSWAHDWSITEYAYNARPGGFGRAWLAALPLGLVGLALLARRRAYAAIALVLVPTLLALVLLTSPWYARYTLFVPGAVWALGAVTLDRMAGWLRGAVAFGLVILASISLVFVNVYPNVRIDLPADPRVPAAAYLNLALSGDESTRSMVDRRAHCSGVDVIPEPARVAVETLYLIPHAVVGPRLQRTLVQPPPTGSTIDELLTYLGDHDVGWLVVRRSGPLEGVISTHGDWFTREGALCQQGVIWRVRQD